MTHRILLCVHVSPDFFKGGVVMVVDLFNTQRHVVRQVYKE